MLSLNNIEVIYDGVILVLKGVSSQRPRGGSATLLGANSAGKTTTLKAISGLLRSERGDVTKGSIEFKNERIDRLPPRGGPSRHRAGVRRPPGLRAPDDRREPDRRRASRGTGIASRPGSSASSATFRVSRTARRQAGYLSGGEQQMLVIGRALMADPHVILLDEPSLGLAPMLVKEIFSAIVQQLNRQEKLTVLLLVEQNASLALTIAEHGYVMENGRIVLDGTAAMLAQNADIKEFYLGLTEVGARKSYRDVKHYKRRKRWLS
jgi:branched-chain amino acid transport system ATP-binding protein